MFPKVKNITKYEREKKNDSFTSFPIKLKFENRFSLKENITDVAVNFSTSLRKQMTGQR